MNGGLDKDTYFFFFNWDKFRIKGRVMGVRKDSLKPVVAFQLIAIYENSDSASSPHSTCKMHF